MRLNRTKAALLQMKNKTFNSIYNFSAFFSLSFHLCNCDLIYSNCQCLLIWNANEKKRAAIKSGLVVSRWYSYRRLLDVNTLFAYDRTIWSISIAFEEWNSEKRVQKVHKPVYTKEQQRNDQLHWEESFANIAYFSVSNLNFFYW